MNGFSRPCVLSLLEKGFTEYSAFAVSLRARLADEPANGIGALPSPCGPRLAEPFNEVWNLVNYVRELGKKQKARAERAKSE